MVKTYYKQHDDHYIYRVVQNLKTRRKAMRMKYVIVLLLALSACAEKKPDRHRICKAIRVACSASDTCVTTVYKDMNTNEIVQANQCDETITQ